MWSDCFKTIAGVLNELAFTCLQGDSISSLTVFIPQRLAME